MELQLAVERLHARYAHALDADKLEAWPEFFTESGTYRITTSENEERGLPLPVLYAEGRAMLRDRVASLRHANIYEPQRYRHIVSAVITEKINDRTVKSLANFLVVRTMQEGDMTLFAAGRYLDQVRYEDGTWKFARKTVVLDSRQIDTLLAIPI